VIVVRFAPAPPIVREEYIVGGRKAWSKTNGGHGGQGVERVRGGHKEGVGRAWGKRWFASPHPQGASGNGDATQTCLSYEHTLSN
jgi:hypothetical protein